MPAMAASPDPVRVEVRGLLVEPLSRAPIVILRAVEGEQFLPIWIGPFEASAIALAIEGTTTPRPMTHDLLRALIEAVEARVERVLIHDLRDGTFHARIDLVAPNGPLAVDSRPSDAIALALRCAAPIFVQPEVFAAAREREEEKGSEEERLKQWLAELPAEDLGKYTM